MKIGSKKIFLIVVFLVLLVIFIVPKGKNDNIQINSKQYSEGSGSKTAVEYLKEKSNDISVTNYNDGNKGEMYTFSHEATYQTPVLTDYRYIGNEPNNYVKFNCNEDGSVCETWRIIGVFNVDDGNGNVEQRIKLVKQKDLEKNMAWNTAGTNDWTTATLTDFLNGDYYNRTGIAETYGLKALSRSMIDDAVYYLGAFTSSASLTAEQLYINERGNVVCGVCNSDVTKLAWTGKVGLMYPSDRYFVYEKGISGDCVNVPTSFPPCYYLNTIGWNSETRGSTFALNSFSDSNKVVFDFNGSVLSGEVADYLRYNDRSRVLPVVYLKSNIYIANGDGSINNPYSLSLSSEKAKNDYIIGDEITFEGDQYYVIDVGSDYVSLLKKIPLTYDEMTKYNNGYFIFHDSDFGIMNYYSSSDCSNVSNVGCKIDYDSSDVKIVVDNWANDKIGDKLISVNGRKTRLLTVDDLINKLGFTSLFYISTDVLRNSDDTPDWVYSSDYKYYTMSGVEDSNFMVYYISKNGIVDVVSVFGESLTVRPVINVSKCELKGNCSFDDIEENVSLDDDSLVNNSNENLNKENKVIVTVANTLKYMSWIIIALSVAIVIMGCSILGYNYYKSRKERK